MAKYNLKLRPIHYASVSGGKDSFFMLNLILNNLEKYPLDMVVHFELEIDWDWSKRVIDFMEDRCIKAGIKFVRIKPQVKWQDLYDRWGFPTPNSRWCNSDYKLDCKRQLEKWIKEQNCRPIAYIGLCADEKKRFRYDIGDWSEQDVCYPLAEENIEEWQILHWAKMQPIFNDYYKYFDRQGCKLCPFLSMKELAYMLKTDPVTFDFMFKCIRETEQMIFETKGVIWKFKGEGADVIEQRVRTKWVSILEYEEKQLSIYDFLDVL